MIRSSKPSASGLPGFAGGCVARFALGAALLSAGTAAGAGLRLKDGSVLQGDIVAREDSALVFRGHSLGEIRIPLSAIADTGAAQVREPYAVAADRNDALQEAGARASGRLDPSDHALFFMPTAFVPPKGTFMFRDFELLFLTLGYAPTASTTLTGGFLFPIAPEIQMLTAGFKQRLWSGAEGRQALAVTGNYTAPIGELADEFNPLFNANLVAGARFSESVLGAQDALGVHGALGWLASRREETYSVETGFGQEERVRKAWRGNLTVGLGAEGRLTAHSKFMVEYLSAAPTGEDIAFEGGFFTFGFRLHGSRLSADISGIRPFLADDMDEFYLLPLLVVSYRI